MLSAWGYTSLIMKARVLKFWPLSPRAPWMPDELKARNVHDVFDIGCE